jgi:SOS response regulatory protein OraA/RecX
MSKKVKLEKELIDKLLEPPIATPIVINAKDVIEYAKEAGILKDEEENK